jgi:hypothetical protein
VVGAEIWSRGGDPLGSNGSGAGSLSRIVRRYPARTAEERPAEVAEPGRPDPVGTPQDPRESRGPAPRGARVSA